VLNPLSYDATFAGDGGYKPAQATGSLIAIGKVSIP
jgi:hypothetical protein